MEKWGMVSRRATLAQIRERHHQMAKLVANGDSDGAIAEAMGYTVNFIAMMRRDPCFAALAEHYRTGEPMFTIPKRTK